uniref:Uncharacterized protein n=1 Tax=Octopus bimaculoides TaxID=37653 RepID=A0A0L8G1G9_OCTBM
MKVCQADFFSWTVKLIFKIYMLLAMLANEKLLSFSLFYSSDSVCACDHVFVCTDCIAVCTDCIAVCLNTEY